MYFFAVFIISYFFDDQKIEKVVVLVWQERVNFFKCKNVLGSSYIHAVCDRLKL